MIDVIETELKVYTSDDHGGKREKVDMFNVLIFIFKGYLCNFPVM